MESFKIIILQMNTYFNVQKHKRILEDWKTQTYYTQEDYANPNADGSFPFIPFLFNSITDEWSSGSCAVQKIALNTIQYINVVWTLTILPDTRRELEIFNRNTQDVIVNYTTTNWWSWQKVISAQWSTIISLTENKNETHFETIDIQLWSYWLWWLQNNLLVINFKN